MRQKRDVVGAMIFALLFSVAGGLYFAMSSDAQTIQRGQLSNANPLYYNDGQRGYAPVQMMMPRSWVPLGYARFAPVTATSLSDTCAGSNCVSLPATATSAIITIGNNPIRWRDDGFAPTSSEGIVYSAGSTVIVENSHAWLAAIKFVNTSAGAAEVNVSFYKNNGE